MRISDALRGVSRLGLDTAPLIYLVERHPNHARTVLHVVDQMADGHLFGVTSVITLGEVLVQPIRQGNASLQQTFVNTILHGIGFRVVTVDVPVVMAAARLRATYNIHLPDACQIAAAIQEGCQAFLTNDRRLARVSELRVLVLDDLEL